MHSAHTSHYKISNQPFTEQEQDNAWVTLFGRSVKGIEVIPHRDRFSMTANAIVLPGAAVMNVRHSPSSIERTSPEVARNWYPLVLSIVHTERVVRTSGKDFALQPGDALLMPTDIRCTMWSAAPAVCTVITMERESLLPMLAKGERKSPTVIRRDHEALRLLRGYLNNLMSDPVSSIELRKAATNHVLDLLALGLGATRSAAEEASARGLAAARLRAVKDYAIAHARRPDLSLSEIAASQRVSARYLRLLFEREGTTFSRFIREYRLDCAQQMLRSPRFAVRPISTIAFEVGFSDLSHFNHAFRARFGSTPGDIREAARLRNEDGAC